MITALQIPSHCYTSFSASLPGFPCYQSIQFSKESCQINPIYGIALQNLFSCQENGPASICVCGKACAHRSRIWLLLSPLPCCSRLAPLQRRLLSFKQATSNVMAPWLDANCAYNFVCFFFLFLLATRSLFVCSLLVTLWVISLRAAISEIHQWRPDWRVSPRASIERGASTSDEP